MTGGESDHGMKTHKQHSGMPTHTWIRAHSRGHSPICLNVDESWAGRLSADCLKLVLRVVSLACSQGNIPSQTLQAQHARLARQTFGRTFVVTPARLMQHRQSFCLSCDPAAARTAAGGCHLDQLNHIKMCRCLVSYKHACSSCQRWPLYHRQAPCNQNIM